MHCQKKSNEIGNAKESLIVMKLIVQNLVKTVEYWFFVIFLTQKQNMTKMSNLK